MNYYPSVEEVFNTLVPQYIVGIVYATMVQAYASEQSARMNAMDSANRNGQQMLDDYARNLNAARQSTVTNENSRNYRRAGRNRRAQDGELK